MVLNEREEEGQEEGSKLREGPRRRDQLACQTDAAWAPLSGSHIAMATCGPCLGPGESGSDGGVPSGSLCGE